MPRSNKHEDYDPQADAQRHKAKARADADQEWEKAAARPPQTAETLSDAVAINLERQKEEEEARAEALDDARFREHLTKIGGPRLVGDLTKALLEMIDQLLKQSGMKKGWKSLPEHQQKDVIGRAEWAAHSTVRAAVSAVAGDRWPALPGALKGVQITDKGYKLVLETSVAEPSHRLALLAAVSKPVLVVLADPEAYAQHDKIKPLRDQPPLPGLPAEPAPTAAAEDSPPSEEASEREAPVH
jgi:hypothetical protein